LKWMALAIKSYMVSIGAACLQAKSIIYSGVVK